MYEYFSTVFTLEDTNALPATEQLIEEGKTCLEQLVVTPGMIEAQIKGLKDNKSPARMHDTGLAKHLHPSVSSTLERTVASRYA